MHAASRIVVAAATVWVLALPCAQPTLASPFPTRDQNPLLADIGLPAAMPAQAPAADRWSWAADFNWGSSAIAASDSDEALVVDAETRELRLSAAFGLTDRLALNLQVPLRYVGPGVLDSFIDGWHDALGFPEGARPSMPKDRVRIAYRRAGMRLVDRRTSQSGLGAASLDVGYRWLASHQTDLTVWASAKLPTSSFDGPGANSTDFSITLAGTHRFGARWSTFGQISLIQLDSGDDERHWQRSKAWSLMGGLAVRTWRNLNLKLQVDAHSAVIDHSQLDFLGDAMILTIGGDYRFASGWLLDLGLSEDIEVDASPDVVIVIGLRKKME